MLCRSRGVRAGGAPSQCKQFVNGTGSAVVDCEAGWDYNVTEGLRNNLVNEVSEGRNAESLDGLLLLVFVCLHCEPFVVSAVSCISVFSVLLSTPHIRNTRELLIEAQLQTITEQERLFPQQRQPSLRRLTYHDHIWSPQKPPAR